MSSFLTQLFDLRNSRIFHKKLLSEGQFFYLGKVIKFMFSPCLVHVMGDSGILLVCFGGLGGITELNYAVVIQSPLSILKGMNAFEGQILNWMQV